MQRSRTPNRLTPRTLAQSLCALLWLGLFGGLLSAVTHAETLPETRFWVTDGSVNSIINNEVATYIGGDFDYVGPNTGLVANINTSTAEAASNFPYVDKSINDNLIGEVYTVISDGKGGWYVGGNFQVVNDADNAYLIHINANNSLNSNFTFRPNQPVHALLLSHDGKTLYVGGRFTNISSIPRQRLAAITLANAEDVTEPSLHSWNPTVDNGQINALALSLDNTTLYIGGSFTSVNGDPNIQGITAIDTTTGTPRFEWLDGQDSTVTGTVNSLNLTRDDCSSPFVLYAGGSFTTIRGLTQARVAALLASNGAPQPWTPAVDDEVNAVFVNRDNSLLYIGGNFANVDGSPQAYLARLATDGGLDTTWTPEINAPVRTLYYDDYRAPTEPCGELETANNTLYIGGDFTEIKKDNAAESEIFERYYLARLTTTADNTSINPWQAHANAPVNSIALRSNGSSVAVGGLFTSISGIRQSNLAELETASGRVNTAWRPKVNGPINLMALNKDFSYLYVAGEFSQIDNKPYSKLARFSTLSAQVDAWAPKVENGEIFAMALSNISFHIRNIAVEPGNSKRVYAATDEGLYFSNDGGLSWMLNNYFQNSTIHHVLIDPQTPKTVYATVGDQGIFRSTDRGLTWQAINTGLFNTTIKDLTITNNSTGPSRLYLSTDMWITDDFQEAFPVHVSEDRGATWTLIANAESVVNDIAIDPIDNNLIYFGNAQGFFIMERAIPKDKTEYTHALRDCNVENKTPPPCNIGLEVGTTITDLIASPEGSGDSASVIYAIASGSLFKSEDAAETWSRVSNNLPRASIISSMSQDPNDPAVIYLTLIGAGVYKTIDSAISWEEINEGLNNLVINTLTIDPNNTNILYTSASRGVVEKSVDAGERWQERHAGIPNDTLYIGGNFFGSHPEYLAAIDTANQSGNLFLNWDTRSTDQVNTLALTSDNATLYVGGLFTLIGGETRNLIAAIDTASAQAKTWAQDTNIIGNSVQALALSDNDQRLYIGGDFNAISTTTGTFTRSNLAAINASDGTLLGWDPRSNASISSLKLTNSDHLIVASGDFTQVGNQNRNFLASITTSSDTENVTLWNPSPSGPLSGRQAFSTFKDILFTAGSFERISNTTRRSLAAFVFLPPTVNASPIGGAFNTTQHVTLSCSHSDEKICEDGDIRYSRDKDLSSTTWLPYTSPIRIDTSTTLSFFSVDTEGVRSEITTHEYIIDNQLPQVDIILPSGKYTTTRTTRLECTDGDETQADVSKCRDIFYTLDDSDPVFITSIGGVNSTQKIFTATATTIKYREDTPVPIRENSTLRVIAVDSAGNISREIVGYYEIERGKGSGVFNPLLLPILLAMFILRAIFRPNTAKQL